METVMITPPMFHITEIAEWTPELAEEIAKIKVFPPRPGDVVFFFSAPISDRNGFACKEGAD